MFQTKHFLKYTIITGVLAGILCYCYFLILLFLGVHPLGLPKELNLGIIIILVFACQYYYKTEIRNGFLHLWEGMSICFLIFIVAGFINASAIFLHVTYLNTNVLTQYIQDNLRLLTQTKAQFITQFDLKAYQNLILQTSKTTGIAIFKDEIYKKIFWAIILTLPISIVMRKQNMGPMQEIERPIKSVKSRS